MKDSKEAQARRSASHIQLLVFPKNSEYIMDDPKEYLKDKTRKEKFSLENLHEKWKRKGPVNFKKIDCKFESKKTRPISTEYKTEEEERQQKQFFDILHGIHYHASEYNENDKDNNNDNEKKLKNDLYINNNKYNDKHSYYLTTKNPWNNNSVFEEKDRNIIDKKIKQSIKIAQIRNENINSQNKSYKSLKERFVKNSFLIKEAKKNKFIENETHKLYNKIKFENPGIEKYPEKINALVFKEMINLYQEYSKYVQNKKNKSKNKNKRNKNDYLYDKKFEPNDNSNNKLRSKHFFTDKEIFEKLQILLTYLKQNKIKIDQKKFLSPLLPDYNKVIQREEYLKKIDKEYEEYIDQKKKEEEKEKSRNVFNISKYPINERTEKEKMVNIYSYHKINIEDSNAVNNQKKKNYFLTAYKNVFEEKNDKKYKREIPIIITERSTNPYGTFDLLNKSKNINEEIKNNENNTTNKKTKRKRPNSSYGSRQVNITYYHPGSFYLFKEGSKEYYAWSCCLNEDKFSKGCSKKYEKVLNFIYKDDM